MTIITGTIGNDTLVGSNQNDDFNGLDGDDVLFGRGGNDYMRGGKGNEVIIAENGNDTLEGERGNDSLGGGNGNDLMYGGEGNDTIDGETYVDRESGSDTIYGNNGQDLIYGYNNDDTLYGDNGDLGNGERDSLLGGAGDDWMYGEGGNDLIWGEAGSDRAFGGTGNDSLFASEGEEYFNGEEGNDYIVSQSDSGIPRENKNIPASVEDGNDLDKLEFTSEFYNGSNLKANDTLVGGEGADMFHFDLLLGASSEIIAKHTNSVGEIDWKGVAGENENYHDHWVDGIGKDTIQDFSGSEGEGDRIYLVGHTVAVTVIEETSQRVTLGVYSDQGADGQRGSKAHDLDVLGKIEIITEGNFNFQRDVFVNSNVFNGNSDYQ